MHKKTKNLPLPRRGRGTGGWGQKDKLKAGSDGNHPRRPPFGDSGGRVGRRGERQAPQRHLFSQPRGRGPSQTPKFLSPGPPSPWLPALPLYGDVSAVFATNYRVLMQGRMVGFASTVSGLVPWWERHCVTLPLHIFALSPAPVIIKSGKVPGGPGDSFKSPPELLAPAPFQNTIS